MFLAVFHERASLRLIFFSIVLVNYCIFCFDRESFQFMYKRPWQRVFDFYSNVVTGRCSLSGLLGIRSLVVSFWINFYFIILLQ